MDFSRALVTITGMVNGVIAGFPDFILAFMIFVVFYFSAKRSRILVVNMTEKRRAAKNLGVVLGKLTESAVIVAGLLVILTVLFPSFQPGDLIQLLGIGSVAIGFAFHDLFQNFLAGILLLLTSPFRIGDQIIVQEFEGTVEDIEMRATTIRTYDGRRVVIPNTDLFTNSVTVNTAFKKRRLEYEIAVDYENDIEIVKEMVRTALAGIEGVLSDPPVEALVVALSDSSITIRISWWTQAHRQTEILLLQDRVLTTLKQHLDLHRILLPSVTQRILLETLPKAKSEKQTDALEVAAVDRQPSPEHEPIR